MSEAERELGTRLLNYDASRAAGEAEDPRRVTQAVLRRDRKRVRRLAGVTVALWLLAAVGVPLFFWLLASGVDKRFAMGFEFRLVAHKVTASDFAS